MGLQKDISMRFAPYSSSRLSLFKQCQRKFKYKYVDKIHVHFEPSVALTRGSILHSLLEHHDSMTLKENIAMLAKDEQIRNSKFYTKAVVKECILIYQNFLKSDIAKEIFAEFKLGTELHCGLNKKLVPCEYLSEDALFRGMIDRITVDKKSNVVRIVDWKSGKDKSTGTYRQPPDQLMNYGSWYFSKFPVDTIIIEYVFVEHNTTLQYTLTRDKLKEYNRALVTDIVSAEKATDFPKTESPLCDFCEFRSHCIDDAT